MAWKVDECIPEDLFIKLMIEKANVIKDYLKKSTNQLIIVANIGPTMTICKYYDTNEEDSLKLCMTLTWETLKNKYVFCGSKQTFCYNNTVLKVKTMILVKLIMLC